MPNWCSNELTMQGKTAEVLQFLEGLKAMPATYEGDERLENSPCYTLNSYVTVPVEIQAKPYSSDYSQPNPQKQPCGYNWQCEHWGTKWDAFDNPQVQQQIDAIIEDLHHQEGETFQAIQFLSAWSPISPWVIQVGKQFPTITFELTYEEEGCDIAGILTVKGDHVEEREYHNLIEYQLEEGAADLTYVMEEFYFNHLEFELEEAGLKKRPNPSETEAYQTWQKEVTTLLEEQLVLEFEHLIERGVVSKEDLMQSAWQQIKLN